ncbi:MAG TPA: GntP family permease, partial [Flavisolibacter sp.]|nr:GntP family permease [Flavisolibacter sp.]
MPAFFALFIASIVVGLGLGFSLNDLSGLLKDGFGSIMKSLGFIIILGTALGVLLEYTGCTRIMASAILRMVGIHKAPLALNVTGFIVGLPVFCDSGFIVLSGLSNSISKKTGISVVLTSVALAVGLYAVHCLVPPHPGITTAAITLGTDLGKLILYGIPVAIGASIAGYI